MIGKSNTLAILKLRIEYCAALCTGLHTWQAVVVRFYTSEPTTLRGLNNEYREATTARLHT